MIKRVLYLVALALFAISVSATPSTGDTVYLNDPRSASTGDIPIIPGKPQSTLLVPGRSFVYFYFDMPVDSKVRNIVVNMIREDNESDPSLYVKIGNRPSRSDYDAADVTTHAFHHVELNIVPQDNRIWIGVYAFSREDAVISLSLDVYYCGNQDCGGSKRGTCAVHTGVCTCKPGYYGKNCQYGKK